jgi:hypothetical protein
MFEVSYLILIPNFFALFALMFMLSITLRPDKLLLGDVSDSESDEEPPVKEKKPPVRYEDKYKEKLNNLVKNNIEKGTEHQEPKKEYQGKTMVIESTPLGNVMMTWNKERESFIYYADVSIPYRFLETVARKYVIMNDCPELYIDMDAEIEACKKEQEDKRKLEEEDEAKKDLFTINEADGEQTTPDKSLKQRKRDVFAKFKVYNNESIKSKAVNISNKKAPPVPRNTNVNTNEKKNVILKTKANRYSCEGKLVNFPFLSNLKRKDYTPPMATTFAEFKRMHMLKK